MIGQGDYFQMQVNYTQGALRYIFQTPNTNWGINDGQSAGWGVVSDAVYAGTLAAGNATDLELTTAWNVNAAYEHFWSPRWRTSLYGGYAQVKYGDTANSILCGFGPARRWLLQPASAVTTIGKPGGSAHARSGTSRRTSTWVSTCSTRKSRAPTLALLQYSAAVRHRVASTARASGTAGQLPQSDVDNFSVRFRVHRDFYP